MRFFNLQQTDTIFDIDEVKQMKQSENVIDRQRARHIVAILMSVVMCTLSLGMVTPTPAQAAAPDRSSELSSVNATVCVWYRVRPGDSLSELAARYGTTVRAIQRANGLRSTRIFVGQRLCIPVQRRPAPPKPPQPPAPGPWYAEFWNNIEQSGPPVWTTNVPAVNFNWGYGSPNPALVFPDYFSARFTRIAYLNAATYRFVINADDGFRLWIDGNIVLDYYNFVGNQTQQIDLPIAAGTHTIRLDYVEYTGIALIKLNYFPVTAPPPPPPPPPPDGKFNNGPWYTEYFANPYFAGPPTFITTVCCLRFDWRGGSPAPGVPGTFWTARFTQIRYFNPGVYQFVARVDDGIRIYLDGNLIMDQFREQSTRTFTANANLGAGNHRIVIEYVQYGGTSDLSVYWDFLGNPNAPAVVPYAPITGPIPYYPPLP
jgi:LysM repeat protein